MDFPVRFLPPLFTVAINKQRATKQEGGASARHVCWHCGDHGYGEFLIELQLNNGCNKRDDNLKKGGVCAIEGSFHIHLLRSRGSVQPNTNVWDINWKPPVLKHWHTFYWNRWHPESSSGNTIKIDIYTCIIIFIEREDQTQTQIFAKQIILMSNWFRRALWAL